MATLEPSPQLSGKDDGKRRSGPDPIRKDSSRSLIPEGKRGSGGSGSDLEGLPHPAGTSPKVNKKFINNWKHACDRTKDRTKELLKKWRTLPEQENEELEPPVHSEESSGWSEHVWSISAKTKRASAATWVKRFPSGEDSMESAPPPLNLTPVQKQKLGNFFTHLLDLDRDEVISLSDIEALFERFRHFADWSKNSAEYHRLLEVQRGFVAFVLIPPDLEDSNTPYEVFEKAIRKQQIEMEDWLQRWSKLLSETRNFLHFPLWLQFFPQILFQVINTSGSGKISMSELGTFYSSVVGLTEREVNTNIKKVYKILTSNGEHELDSSVYRLCFANFVLGRFPNGPGQCLLYPLGLDQTTFPIDYKALSCAPNDLEQYSPVVQTNRRSVIV